MVDAKSNYKNKQLLFFMDEIHNHPQKSQAWAANVIFG